MSKTEPIVQKFMTTQPFSIEANQTIKSAEKFMEEKRIRHLPIMKEGKVYGILSDRDIKMALGILGSNPELLKVADVCQPHPYTVSPDAKLHEVADEMATHHYGSAIVEQNGKLVGILTTVDICKALSWVLEQRFHAH